MIIKKAYSWFTALCLFLLPLAFCNILNHSFVQGKELFFKVLILLAVFLISLYLVIRKKLVVNRFWKSKIGLISGLFLLIFFLSTCFSSNSIVSLYGSFSRGFGFIIFCFLAVFYLINASFASKKSVKKALIASYISSFIVGFYAILQKFGIDYFFQQFDIDIFVKRSFSFLGNPSYLGQFLALNIIIGLYFLQIFKKTWQKIVFASFLPFIIGGLITSEARASILALGIALIFIFIKYLKNLKKYLTYRNIFVWSILGILLIFSTILALRQYVDIKRFDVSKIAVRSMESRFGIWGSAVSLIARNPLGYGLETFYIYFPDTVTPAFFTLEEDLNIFADRIHNEFLEATFSIGIIGGMLYLFLFGLIIYRFFKEKDLLLALLYLILLANFIQNQFSFSDIVVAVLITFIAGAVSALDKNRSVYTLKLKPVYAYLQFLLVLLIVPVIFINTVFRPFKAHLYYSQSNYLRDYSFDYSVLALKEALYQMPYYSQMWYDLLMLDPSSLARSLHYLSQIEGETGYVLAWKGNYYSIVDPEASYGYFEALLKRNPLHPHWVRAYADDLYRNKKYEKALEMYKRYLELVPNFWKWKDSIQQRSQEDQRKYRIFFKNVPDFWNVPERVKKLEEMAK